MGWVGITKTVNMLNSLKVASDADSMSLDTALSQKLVEYYLANKPPVRQTVRQTVRQKIRKRVSSVVKQRQQQNTDNEDDEAYLNEVNSLNKF